MVCQVSAGTAPKNTLFGAAFVAAHTPDHEVRDHPGLCVCCGQDAEAARPQRPRAAPHAEARGREDREVKTSSCFCGGSLVGWWFVIGWLVLLLRFLLGCCFLFQTCPVLLSVHTVCWDSCLHGMIQSAPCGALCGPPQFVRFGARCVSSLFSSRRAMRTTLRWPGSSCASASSCPLGLNRFLRRALRLQSGRPSGRFPAGQLNICISHYKVAGPIHTLWEHLPV